MWDIKRITFFLKYLRDKIGPRPWLTFFNCIRYFLKYRNILNPYEIIAINPQEIQVSLNRDFEKKLKIGLGATMSGNWDKKVVPINNKKYQSVFNHYVNDTPWIETSLFMEEYKNKINRGISIRGCNSLSELERFYQCYDDIFFSLREDGFKQPSFSNPEIRYIYVYIGRNGEIIYGGGGNHRLAMLHVLGIKKIQARVLIRHSKWVEKKITKSNGKRKPTKNTNHPDYIS